LETLSKGNLREAKPATIIQRNCRTNASAWPPSGRPAAGSRVYNLLDAFGISTRADSRFDQGMQNGDVVNLIPPSGAQMICLF
jgi:hypothetical protein